MAKGVKLKTQLGDYDNNPSVMCLNLGRNNKDKKQELN